MEGLKSQRCKVNLKKTEKTKKIQSHATQLVQMLFESWKPSITLHTRVVITLVKKKKVDVQKITDGFRLTACTHEKQEADLRDHFRSTFLILF